MYMPGSGETKVTGRWVCNPSWGYTVNTQGENKISLGTAPRTSNMPGKDRQTWVMRGIYKLDIEECTGTH